MVLKWLKLTVLIVIAGAGGFFLCKIYESRKNSACTEKYKYTNSQIACSEPSTIDKTGYANLQADLTKYVDDRVAAGDLSSASIYFRDLDNGPIFGVNEQDDFVPASLLKVPVAITYLSLSKQIPGLLQEQLAYLKSEAEVVQILGADETIQPGVKYPVEDLLRRMLVYSDNNSYYLLSDYLNKINQSNAVNQTLLDLGVVTPNDIFDEAISTRRYASILRTLYTSSYLSPDDSEKILGWLAEAKFNDGLRAGVAAGVPIAHKFGVRDEDGKEPELHDCGIVYFPKNPYILCVMTRGKDYAKLADTIKTVSGKVYGEIDSRRINP